MKKDSLTLRVVRMCLFDLMGFRDDVVQKMVVEAPSLLSEPYRKLVRVFDLLHNTGLITHEIIANQPEVLLASEQQVIVVHSSTRV